MLWYNRSLLVAYPFLSCQVAGSGIQLARALTPDHASHNAIDQFATNNPEFSGANIGSIPPLFDRSIDTYEHLEFLKLILNTYFHPAIHGSYMCNTYDF